MFEVLMFLFENYMDGSVSLTTDNNLVVVELEKAGFSRHEIGRALNWLEGLMDTQASVANALVDKVHSTRNYTVEECERLSVEARGFLAYLEQLNILDVITREVVLDRLMALDIFDVDIRSVRWVVLMALFNRPDRKAALSLFQDLILADAFDVLH